MLVTEHHPHSTYCQWACICDRRYTSAPLSHFCCHYVNQQMLLVHSLQVVL